MKPVRILFVSHSHPKPGAALENMGGMQRVSMHLWQELQQSTRVEIKGLILQADWNEIGRKTAGFLWSLRRRLPQQVESFKPDVILFSSMVTASVAVFLRKQIQVPMVAINHGQDVTLPYIPYQWWIKRVFNALDATISVSAATREQTVNRGMKPNRAFIIHNGFYPVEPQSLKRTEIRTALYEKLRLSWDPSTPLLLSVGRQVKRKGHLWFLKEVLPKISTPVNVMLIGEGPETAAIKRVAKEFPAVFLAGRRPDAFLKQAYAAADVFIMPNIPVSGDMEGFGIVLVEANAAGLPVIASRLEGMVDVIEDGANGILVDPMDAGAWAGTVDALLKEDLEAFSSRARDHAVDRFSWNQIRNQYVDVLQQLAAGGRKA